MIITPHILVGAAIGSKISSPVAIFILALISHYVLDALPHFEYNISLLKDEKSKINKNFFINLTKVAADLLIGLALTFWLISGKDWQFLSLIGALTAIVPDGLLFLFWRYPSQLILKSLGQFHKSCHLAKKISSPAWLGLMVQAMIIILTIVFLFKTP